jgi:hypothetical protein
MSADDIRASVGNARKVKGRSSAAPMQVEPPEVHPLARFVDLDESPKPPRMVIPGFVQAGVVVIAGAHGSGKTTALVPLALVAAGVHAAGDPLAPRHWRHVVYIAEDVAQVQRIVQGLAGRFGIGIKSALVAERLHLAPALRMPAEEVAEAGPIYRERFTRHVDGVDLPPLVVIDTKSAVIDSADDNDNAEAGRMVALFKQRFADLPLWIVGHVAKTAFTRNDLKALSARGASALEADAHQTVFLVTEDDGRRFLLLGKRRFEPRWPELEVVTHTADVTASNEFGEDEPLTLRWGLPAPPEQTRAEAKAAAALAADGEARTALRGAILDAVEAAERAGRPLSRRGVEEVVSGRATDVRGCIALLVDQQWLWPVQVPAAIRANAARSEFLIRLNDAERRGLIEGRQLSDERLAVPGSWRKSLRPEPDAAKAAGGGE